MNNLKQKTINGMIWTVSERFSVQIVQLLVSILLARLLEPSEFGLIGMLAIFTALAQSIMDSGFGSALIRKKQATQVDASSIFYFNLGVGCFLAIILFLSAPFIAKFYNQPILIPLTSVLSLNLIINSFSLVQTSLLTKNMNFNIQLKVSLSAVILSGTIGIIMAYSKMGVWSLAVQMISNYFFKAIFLWFLSDWRPTLAFSFTSIRSMFSFGSKLLISGIIEIIFRNIYQTFIGKVYSPTDLGYYTRALTFETAATQATSSSLSKVIYSALSPFQDNNKTLKQAYRKTIRMSLFLHFPLMFGLVAIAQPLITFLVTEKWAPSVPFFQMLCLVGLWYPLRVLFLNIVNIKGRSDLTLQLLIVEKLLIIGAIMLTYNRGIMFLLYGQIATSIFFYLISSLISGKLIDYRVKEQMNDLVKSFLLSICMYLFIQIVGIINFSSDFLLLITQILSGIIFYLIINYLLRSTELFEYYKIVSNLLISLKIKKINKI